MSSCSRGPSDGPAWEAGAGSPPCSRLTLAWLSQAGRPLAGGGPRPPSLAGGGAAAWWGVGRAVVGSHPMTCPPSSCGPTFRTPPPGRWSPAGPGDAWLVGMERSARWACCSPPAWPHLDCKSSTPFLPLSARPPWGFRSTSEKRGTKNAPWDHGSAGSLGSPLWHPALPRETAKPSSWAHDPQRPPFMSPSPPVSAPQAGGCPCFPSRPQGPSRCSSNAECLQCASS